jgi:hypothetical protein
LILCFGCSPGHYLRDGHIGIRDDSEEGSELFQILVRT